MYQTSDSGQRHVGKNPYETNEEKFRLLFEVKHERSEVEGEKNRKIT